MPNALMNAGGSGEAVWVRGPNLSLFVWESLSVLMWLRFCHGVYIVEKKDAWFVKSNCCDNLLQIKSGIL